MNQEHKLSLFAAIFININIMIGAGLFINTSNIAQMVGAAGFLSYAILALLLYPLIASIAQLVHIYPQGGFFTYAHELTPFTGFLSAWSYFIGKLASATILIHVSMLLLQQIIPAMNVVNIYLLDIIVLIFFLFLNLFNLRTGASIQVTFLTLKLIPISFVIGAGLYLFSTENYSSTQLVWAHFIDTLPFVLFAAIGFEATTSLSNKIKDPQKNGPRAILISYVVVSCINIAYQFFFYGAVGQQLQQTNGFLSVFPLFLHTLLTNHVFIHFLQTIFYVAIATSALGGAYGILFSNSWNLHTLAHKGYIPYQSLFLQENRYQIPYRCIIAEGIVCLIYLITTQAAQIPLQQIAAFGCTIAYTLSITSLLYYSFIHKQRSIQFLALCGIINCCVFLGSCLHSFATKGYYSLIIFGSFMIIGIIIYYVQSSSARNAQS